MNASTPPWHTLLRFLFSALGLLAASALVPGIGHGTLLDLLIVAMILGLLNSTLGFFLKVIAFIPVACSFGCFSLVINGLVFWMAAVLSSKLGLNFTVSGFWAGFFGALITSLVASLLSAKFIPNTPQPPQGTPPIKVVN